MREKMSRFDNYMKYKGLNDNQVTVECKLSQGLLGQARNGKSDLGNSTINKILNTYQDLNRVWLLTGEGEMIQEESTYEFKKTTHSGIPYYEDLPVSAGQIEVLLQEANPTGYIDIPGLRAQALFPVVGCSMKPEINPGDVVGVESINNWDMIDPDKIYMIITNDDRMIKHLEIDDDDPEVLWCVSPNYKRFRISKCNIKAIYRICYVGKLM